jgi:tRNA dimethylallyltransferase
MSASRPRLIVVCGPTATGKTAFAMRLARELAGEIVNADSMQVYRYMDIGTAKPSAEDRAAVVFHLMDVVDPDDTFSAGRFRDAAQAAVQDILARGRLPIVAGGTGLYIKALTKGLFEGPRADKALRAKYKEQEAAEPGSLRRRLQEIDPERAREVHVADYVRLERSLEVFDLTGKPISAWQREHAFAESAYDVLKIGLDRPRKELAAVCERRVERMMAQGWLEEVRRLRAMGYGPALPSQAAIGYKELHRFLDGKITLAEAIDRAQSATRQFAKRQRTWFGADSEIRWFDAAHEAEAAAAAARSFAPRP